MTQPPYFKYQALPCSFSTTSEYLRNFCQQGRERSWLYINVVNQEADIVTDADSFLNFGLCTLCAFSYKIEEIITFFFDC
jgi:hypothetical protein